ncbi:unnamed protein product [Ceratitis capitata]|uniref:(Mediterranean fruit fly) hypothetical protein n=1 Tax=Ceratitis capitata TaxID=7213 RepID=A0A811U2R1_CERCA|nr:unnamed protein product [Ceratitis capitata]
MADSYLNHDIINAPNILIDQIQRLHRLIVAVTLSIFNSSVRLECMSPGQVNFGELSGFYAAIKVGQSAKRKGTNEMVCGIEKSVVNLSSFFTLLVLKLAQRMGLRELVYNRVCLNFPLGQLCKIHQEEVKGEKTPTRILSTNYVYVIPIKEINLNKISSYEKLQVAVAPQFVARQPSCSQVFIYNNNWAVQLQDNNLLIMKLMFSQRLSVSLIRLYSEKQSAAGPIMSFDACNGIAYVRTYLRHFGLSYLCVACSTRGSPEYSLTLSAEELIYVLLYSIIWAELGE